ncbi:MAG: AAA family ATPase [Clostridiales bacterium]|jgi:DNA repair exonuclease SbcCD ATPase subunit|nr:AAA family ATPase [Clostridiales bacterium]
MKIISCNIENFGTLSGFSHRFDDGLNVIYQKNGWGKTTLSAFIKSMFFGLPETKKRDVSENDRIKYTPWRGGAFGGGLVFETDGRVYRIERFFGSKLGGGGDEFKLFDGATNKPSGDFSAKIGEELFGVNADSFERTVYIPQKELKTDCSGDIGARLNALIYNADDARSYESAAEELKLEERALCTTGGRGSLFDAERGVSEAQSRLEGSMRARLDAERLRKELEAKTREADALERAASRQTESGANAPLRIFDGQTERGADAHERAAGAQTNGAKNCNNALDGDKNGAKRKKPTAFAPYALMIAGGISAAVSAVLFFADALLGVIAAALAVALFAAGAVFLRVRGDKAKNRPYGGYSGESREAVGESPSDAGENAGQAALNVQIKRLRAVCLEISDLQRRLADAESAAERESECADALSAARARYADIEKRLGIIRKTREFLYKAKEKLSSGYLPPLEKNLIKYMGRLTADDGQDLSVDTSLTVGVMGGGRLRDLGYLGAGQRECVDIAMRFALIDCLYEEKKPFVVLDDPFAELDGEKLQSAKKLLRGLANDRQIIYFTCHESRIF